MGESIKKHGFVLEQVQSSVPPTAHWSLLPLATQMFVVAQTVSPSYMELFVIYIVCKGILITGHEASRRSECKGPRIHSHGTRMRQGGQSYARPPLPPGKFPRYSFYRRLSGPQDQSGHEGVKKNLDPSDTRHRTRAVQPAAKRLAA